MFEDNRKNQLSSFCILPIHKQTKITGIYEKDKHLLQEKRHNESLFFELSIQQFICDWQQYSTFAKTGLRQLFCFFTVRLTALKISLSIITVSAVASILSHITEDNGTVSNTAPPNCVITN